MFKTAFELDQRWIIELGADRAPFICQAQSVNVFIPADIHKRDLHQIHYQAWKKGLKSLYYCRSKSIQRAEVVSHNHAPNAVGATNGDENGPESGNGVFRHDLPSPDEIRIPVVAALPQEEEVEYEECLACQ